jgi:hypothetical protein
MYTDEGYDNMNNPKHCGGCNIDCSTMVTNGGPACNMGNCEVAFCFTGYYDLDTDPTDCEYMCNFQGDEVCNGEDDDCDGKTDEGLTPPAICNQVNECSGAAAECQGTSGWVCRYDLVAGDVSHDGMGNLVPESDCDGKDNDCDGVPDDAYPTLGDSCTRGAGTCQTSGNIVCNSAQTGIECNAAAPSMGSAETCNGLDDDCDNKVDEGAPDDWVQVGSFWIYQYEASRQNATSSNAGTREDRPCSLPNRIPWANITQPEAEAKCAAIGARLCSESEWQQACQAGSSCTWSYANNCTTYSPNRCNGNDYDPSGAPGDQDQVVATSAMSACYANWGGLDLIYDMSGNLKEWTAERSAGVNPLRGGSYNNTAVGISCTHDFVVADDTFQFENVGFRCCRSTAP